MARLKVTFSRPKRHERFFGLQRVRRKAMSQRTAMFACARSRQRQKRRWNGRDLLKIERRVSSSHRESRRRIQSCRRPGCRGLSERTARHFAGPADRGDIKTIASVTQAAMARAIAMIRSSIRRYLWRAHFLVRVPIGKGSYWTSPHHAGSSDSAAPDFRRALKIRGGAVA